MHFSKRIIFCTMQEASSCVLTFLLAWMIFIHIEEHYLDFPPSYEMLMFFEHATKLFFSNLRNLIVLTRA